MPTLHLTETDLQSTINDLRIAAERYDDHAATLRGIHGQERLAEQFQRQADDARRRANAFEV